ncbi:regulatory protein GemA [uncultured Kiloniella sp.]|uniref:regulatory protein GemA n=1 Tax=uncultured Kiloniella sp. TaxID=1133091 RepID=UPI002604296E|nr:regulatory protein GemA [uncultured Kiloniella sp.]
MSKRSPMWLRKNAAIRAACKEFGISEDERRAIIYQVTRNDSLGKCRDGEIANVLDKINEIYRPQKKQGKVTNNRSNHPGDKAIQNKILALWLVLYDLGLVESNTDKALNGFIKRQLKVDTLRWVTGYQADKLIRILKTMAADRGDVDWSLDQNQPEQCVIHAQYRILVNLGQIKHADTLDIQDYAGYVTGKQRGWNHYSFQDWRDLQKNWGKWIRRVKAKHVD